MGFFDFASIGDHKDFDRYENLYKALIWILGGLSQVIISYFKSRWNKPKLMINLVNPNNGRSDLSSGLCRIVYNFSFDIINQRQLAAHHVSVDSYELIDELVGKVKLLHTTEISYLTIFSYNAAQNFTMRIEADVDAELADRMIDVNPIKQLTLEYQNESGASFKTIFYPYVTDISKKHKYRRRIVFNWWL
ncbi:hypothetical protein [Hymenobacter lapidiphilus]|uniref:hypothetical protein n=1 Tax=Hymenobacter sp. CCM 8763 TaxID=2303334 RepID=UPI0011C13799|nr:hypothetical protein [Hymenobacter sp. CCM 8763]